MTPSDQMSVRASTVRAERICSGDMYEGEPSTAWVLVISRSALPSTLEMPKSEHLDAGAAVVALGEEEVGGLEVAVDDAHVECASSEAASQAYLSSA